MRQPASRRGWKSKADRLWSAYVRNRDKVCRMCGKSPINAHHIVSRRYHSTRFIPANGISLCVKCHYIAHQNPLTFHKWLVENLGQKHLDTLEELSRKIEKLNYEQVCLALKSIERTGVISHNHGKRKE